MTRDQRLARAAEVGLDGAAIVRFTPEVARWAPDEFVNMVLVDWLHVSEVWVGANFLFGRDRSGNFSLLRSLGSTLRISRRESRTRALQGVRGQQHTNQASD